MPPAPEIATSARLRSATTRAASLSDSAPATCAAAISPCECPRTTVGCTPCARHSAASETKTANEHGCTTSIRSSAGAPGAPRRTSSSSQSTNGRSASAQACICSANSFEVSHSSTAIPFHCEPWPGKTNATPPSSRARPSTTWSAGSCAATASRPASSAPGSLPTTTARCASRARPIASEKPTSSGRSSGRAATCARSRDACSRSASGVFAERIHGTAPRAERAEGAVAVGGLRVSLPAGWFLAWRLAARRVRGRRLLEHDVRVRPADPERRHGSSPRPIRGGGPVLGLRQQPHGARGPVDVRARRVDVQRPRQHPRAHRHDHLDDARDAGRRLRVADVRLDRAEPQRRAGAVAPVRGEQRLRLDRIAEPRAGAVRLDGVDVAGREAAVGERLADDLLLGRAVGRRQAVARAVLVRRAAAHEPEHAVPEAARVRQPLDGQQGRALRPAGPVRARGERLAAPVRRQAALAAELDEHARRREHGHAARERERALAAAQRLAGEVQRDQRRRARGVDRQRRALQPERVRHAAGHDARQRAGEVEPLELVVAAGLVGAVVLRADAGEDAGRRAAQRLGVDAGVLERLPRGLEQQALLGIHRQRLARGDAEERGIELGRVVEKAAAARRARAGVIGVGVVEAFEIPAAVLGEAADRVGAGGDELPQLLRRAHPAGVAAADPDDRDRALGERSGAGARARRRGRERPLGPLAAVEQRRRAARRPRPASDGRRRASPAASGP